VDLKAKIDEIVQKVKGDKDFAAKFASNPVNAIESIVGLDLPDDQIKPLVEGVKAKIAGDQTGNIMGNINKLF